jgi:hypothetical protein
MHLFNNFINSLKRRGENDRMITGDALLQPYLWTKPFRYYALFCVIFYAQLMLTLILTYL